MAYKILLTERTSDLAIQLASDFEALTFGLQSLRLGGPWQQDSAGLEAYFEHYAPNILINTLGSQADLALITQLAVICAQRDITLIHLSSVEVFAPRADAGLCCEDAAPSASHARALALIEAEQAVAGVPRHIILRLPYLTCPTPGSWLDQLCRALLHADGFAVSELQRLDPLSLPEASRVVVALAQQILCGAENWGVLHLHTADACSEAELAEHLARILKKAHLATAQLDAIKAPSAWLPPIGILGGERLTDQFGVQMLSWRIGLKLQVQQWLEQQRQGELF